MFMEENNYESTCACKGIRRCLLCEDSESQHNQNTLALAAAKVV